MALKIYGIPNCDTVKKARTWLTNNGIEFEFHNYKKEGITPAKLEQWLGQVELRTLVNRAGTTFRKLSDEEKNSASEPKAAIDLMVQHNSIIKRPVLEQGDEVLAVGFKPEIYEGLDLT
jgi:arsenate reductase